MSLRHDLLPGTPALRNHHPQSGVSYRAGMTRGNHAIGIIGTNFPIPFVVIRRKSAFLESSRVKQEHEIMEALNSDYSTSRVSRQSRQPSGHRLTNKLQRSDAHNGDRTAFTNPGDLVVGKPTLNETQINRSLSYPPQKRRTESCRQTESYRQTALFQQATSN